MPSQVITVDRKKYAVGLFWQPTGAGYVARAYARLLARSVDKKLNLYTEYRAMVGLGAKKFGHRVGMDSAAAAVTDALGEYTSFLAVFSADANFYLVAVRNVRYCVKSKSTGPISFLQMRRILPAITSKKPSMTPSSL